MFGELDDLETLFWLSYLGPGVEEESGDLDVSVHRCLHERGVHLIGLVLLVRAGVKQEPGRENSIFEDISNPCFSVCGKSSSKTEKSCPFDPIINQRTE